MYERKLNYVGFSGLYSKLAPSGGIELHQKQRVPGGEVKKNKSEVERELTGFPSALITVHRSLQEPRAQWDAEGSQSYTHTHTCSDEKIFNPPRYTNKQKQEVNEGCKQTETFKRMKITGTEREHSLIFTEENWVFAFPPRSCKCQEAEGHRTALVRAYRNTLRKYYCGNHSVP